MVVLINVATPTVECEAVFGTLRYLVVRFVQVSATRVHAGAHCDTRGPTAVARPEVYLLSPC